MLDCVRRYPTLMPSLHDAVRPPPLVGQRDEGARSQSTTKNHWVQGWPCKNFFDGTKLPMVGSLPETTTCCVSDPVLDSSSIKESQRPTSIQPPTAQILGTVSPVGDKIELTVTIVAR
jgi:hypothetical protein